MRPVVVAAAVAAVADPLSRPSVAVAVAVGLLAVVAGALLLARYRRPAGVRLARALADREAVAVLTHPNPDPDAMAAAVGIACIAERVGTRAVVQYPGQIRHQENRAFQTVLDLDLDPIERAEELAADAVVLVDHGVPRGFEGADRVTPFAVIDHHPGAPGGESFTDVRTNYGACSSIVAGYYRDLGVRPVPPDDAASGGTDALSPVVATGLLYGILSDTNRLTEGAEVNDFAACRYLSPGVDRNRLRRIADPVVSAEVLEVKARAIAGRRVEGSFAVSDVGRVSNVDALPQAADELVRLAGVTAVVVCGEYEGTIHLSGRSRDDRVHMGRALSAAVDGIAGATAGGHARMGGGQIPTARADADGTEGAGSAGRDGAIADGRVDGGGTDARRATLCERTGDGRAALAETLFASMDGDV